MELNIGVDSYASVGQADAYIAGRYPQSDPGRIAWEAADEADKEAYLRTACGRMERLCYRGVCFEAGQALAFPRYFGANYAMIGDELYAPELDRYPFLKKVPEEVIHAQIEEALEIASPTQDSETRELLNGPVASYTIGNLSETLRSAAAGGLETALSSRAAKELLRRFTEGAYEVR